jgi:hypothetical protein
LSTRSPNAVALQGVHRTLDIALPNTYTEHFRSLHYRYRYR